ncbi:hypothetical protein B0J13DRAFT_638817 [Dactylonectria estremocensis]|uniref:GPI inositol-deacylase n=1 Tax=Dactylonectria estremocensis TaxID=1079267 RepID=A0A9P9EMM4_9HYPO|nr:hypothetical protein B0J13DRAFT_638817 [Dactylonectria estremocensis]
MNQVLIRYGLIVGILNVAFFYYKFTKGIPTRLVAENAPKARFELVPASTYNVPAPTRGIDIIFVHGLGSNPDTTWRAGQCSTAPEAPEEACPESDRYVTWVCDFLPGDLYSDVRQDIRLFFYNYDAYWKRDALPERLSTLGVALVGRITSGIRTTDAERSRDLIFVAHSYGGLVVKKALLLAKADTSQSYIAEATKAVLFLGTPHRGSSFSYWGWWQAQALWLLGSNPSILADLHYDSASLRDLHDEFVRIDRGNMTVFNFYEQRPIRLAQLWFLKWQEYCVRESSATYGGPRVYNFGLSVDHYGLNKFGSRDVNYQFVLSKLREITLSLAVSAKYSYAVPLETVESYTQREELWSELKDKLRIRHDNASVPYAVAISGLGGVGKSQLALKFAETHKDRYNPILWIDATDAESVRSSFQRCAVELGLPENGNMKHGSALTDDSAVQGVLRWLRDRNEVDDEWLFIVDNADDLVPRGCEQVQVGDMTAEESMTLLLHHLGEDADGVPTSVAARCEQVADKLGYLALAVDLAGAYIGNDPDPKSALKQYLQDFTRHRDDLLQMDRFRGLLPTEKTVWTVWDTTLEKIARDNPQLHPNLLLTFLAHFRGTIIQDEMLRLAALGISRIQSTTGERLPVSLQEFLSVDEGKWDSFQYRKSREVMLRYNLLKRVDGEWPGVTMHGLVQWRALKSSAQEEIPQKEWYMIVILAACSQMTEERHQPEFRRHLMTHLPQISELGDDTTRDSETRTFFMQGILAHVYHDEGRWDEAEKLLVEAMKIRKAKLGADHPDTLISMANLASTYRNQGQWDKAEKLEVKVMEISKAKLGADHLDTLTSMGNLASTLLNQGRWDEAEKLLIEVMETRKAKLGANHPNTLISMSNLASTLLNQGRWDEAEKLFVEVIETHKAKLKVDYPNMLTSMGNLASTLWNQGRWNEAGKLFIEVMETSKAKLGANHPHTLIYMGNLASTLLNQGRWNEAKKLFIEVMETSKAKLGADHPNTLISISNLASTYWNQGRWNKAEKLEVEVMKTRKAKLGADHPDTLISMANLASTYWNQGRWNKAEKLEVEVMETSKAKLGADHPDTLRSMRNLAITWRNQGRHEEALALMRECIQACERALGLRHPFTLLALATIEKWN